jgi:hypothetical protein
LADAAGTPTHRHEHRPLIIVSEPSAKRHN